MLNTVGTEYIGPVTITGNGGSTCEGASTGGGNLTLTYAQGFGPTQGRLDCASPSAGTTLSGTYLRIGTAVTATLNGNPFASGSSVSAEGAYTLHLTASDAAGNATTRDVTFVIDETKPVIAISGVTDGTWYNAPVTPGLPIEWTRWPGPALSWASRNATAPGGTLSSSTRARSRLLSRWRTLPWMLVPFLNISR